MSEGITPEQIVGGATALLVDPGNVWEPDTVIAEDYRIAETVQGELRVFEVVTAGTTGGSAEFTDYDIALTPLGEFATGAEVGWRYLGIVGEVSWEVSPLRPEFGVDDDGPYIAGHEPISEAETTFRILPALGDPGNEWEAEAEISESGYRIAVLVDGALRVFQVTTLGTTGASEPDWDITTLGHATADGTASWAYSGIVGDPDFERPVLVANSAGDADWYLDVNNGSGFRFNQAVDGVFDLELGATEFTTNGFKVYMPTASFEVRYSPFSISMVGLPTVNPNVAGHLWVESGTLKVSAG